jgi:hypothetical protein
MVGEKRNSQIVVNLPVADVPKCTSSNAKTLGLNHLLLPNVASCSEPPDGARLMNHGTDELPVQQNAALSTSMKACPCDLHPETREEPGITPVLSPRKHFRHGKG